MFSDYEDFYLIVNGKDGHYTVEAQGSGQVSTEPVPFVYREDFELEEALEEIFSGYSPSRSGMQLIGEWLFNILLPTPILMALGSTRQALSDGVRLRLRLNIRPPELARLPWESVRLVVLAACESAMDSTGERFVGVAQRLMRASNLPAVVAMQFSIPDRMPICHAQSDMAGMATISAQSTIS